MNRKKVGVIFGGISTEHDVSVVSGTDIMRNIDKDKYEVIPIYIDEEGNWHEYKLTDKIFKVGDKITEKNPIENICEYLKKVDVVFPVLHGLGGEDGSIQGMLELLKIPYVGSKVLGSSVCMDKVYAKIIFEKAGLLQTKYLYIRKYKENYIYVKQNFDEEKCTIDEIVKIADEQLKYPMFIKPSNSGSSVGVKKACIRKELEEAIEFASKFDKKVLVEQEIKGHEVECAVLGNEEVIASNVGEIKSADEFYDFDSKYKNSESKTIIPAEIPKEKQEEIRKSAIKIFKAIDGKGMSRVDFFVEYETNEVYFNEINTIPGFTQISMYPKMIESSGIKYSKLLDKLIELAVQK